jgi:hypothetical protein
MHARQARRWTALFTIGLLAMPVMAADDKPYTEGNVVEVTSVLTKPGKFDEYMTYLAGPFRQQQEELKKAGVVVDYNVYMTMPRRAGDPDLYLTVTYKDMAALDNLEEKTEASSRKIYGTRQQAAQGAADRESIRTILGSELIRQLKLK